MTDWKKLLGSQVLSLPEDILKKKWAGDFKGVLHALEARLQSNNLPELLRDRLLIERALLEKLMRQYPYSKARALNLIRKRIPDFSEDEFDRYEAEGGIDFLFLEGEKRYFESVFSMLLDWDRSLIPRAGGSLSPARPLLDAAIAEIEEQGNLCYRIRMRVELCIEENAFVEGETYRVHLPVPKPCAQQLNIEIVPEPDGIIAPEESPQRTVFYERMLEENRPFAVEYAYDSVIYHKDSGRLPVYPSAAPVTEDDLCELPPHIVFTPYLRQLAQEVRKELEDPMQIARACYDFVTKTITYSYLRDYILVENVAEYVALNLKGDCGAQTLLFMALLRLNAIPARWQSGTNASPDTTGAHDWAMFYVEPYGWLHADCSRGGGAYRVGSKTRWDFYFGHLDPYRMVANSEYFASFVPPKRFLRNDPYDNQSGECETDTRALLPDDLSIRRKIIGIEKRSLS